MIMYNIVPAMLLAATSIAPAMAAQCSAVGYWSTNSAGAGNGGTTVSSGKGVTLLDPDGNDIGAYEGDYSPCADLLTWSSDYLDDTFSWGATCDMGGFTECHGAYGTQTHIDGEDPTSGTNFYGLGISVSSGCVVLFDC